MEYENYRCMCDVLDVLKQRETHRHLRWGFNDELKLKDAHDMSEQLSAEWESIGMVLFMMTRRDRVMNDMTPPYGSYCNSETLFRHLVAHAFPMYYVLRAMDEVLRACVHCLVVLGGKYTMDKEKNRVSISYITPPANDVVSDQELHEMEPAIVVVAGAVVNQAYIMARKEGLPTHKEIKQANMFAYYCKNKIIPRSLLHKALMENAKHIAHTFRVVD